MPFFTHVTSITTFPHLMSKMEPSTKAMWKERYRSVKFGMTTLGGAGVTTAGLIELASDIAQTKIKARGYNLVATTLAGPLLQTIGLPFYVYRIGKSVTKAAIAVIQIGSWIIHTEYTMANFAWIIPDYIVFGEWVDQVGDKRLCIVSNETVNEVFGIVEKAMGGIDGE